MLPDPIYKYYKRQNSITTRAKRHVKGLCSCLADNPTSPALREATGLFLTTLYACGDTKNSLLLRISALLSRIALGRFTLRLAEAIVGRIVWR